MNLPDTRKIITAILNGEIGESEWQHDSVFGFEIPLHVGGVDTAILNPRNTWADHHAFDQTRIKLAKMFIENFKKYADDNPTLAAVGPVVTE